MNKKIKRINNPFTYVDSTCILDNHFVTALFNEEVFNTKLTGKQRDVIRKVRSAYNELAKQTEDPEFVKAIKICDGEIDKITERNINSLIKNETKVGKYKIKVLYNTFNSDGDLSLVEKEFSGQSLFGCLYNFMKKVDYSALPDLPFDIDEKDQLNVIKQGLNLLDTIKGENGEYNIIFRLEDLTQKKILIGKKK